MAFERRALGHRGFALVSIALERDGFLAAFTERTGGTSGSPYDSMNLSLTVGDDLDHVRANRSRLVQGLAIPGFASAEQVHGACSVRVGAKRALAGFEDASSRVARADALSTASRGVALAVLTADCVPLIVASAAEGKVTAVHAGWRGLAAGIIGAALESFEDRRAARCVIGPAIGPCHYEVGADVLLAVSAASDAEVVIERRAGSLYLDLVGTVRRWLRALGVRKIEDTGLCTACERRRLFSHRRDGPSTGRQAAIAMRL
jgi:YfiH family protein